MKTNFVWERRWIVVSLALLALILPATALAQDGPMRPTATDPYWSAAYFNNVDLAGSPVLTRNESTLDWKWGFGSPDAAVSPDYFSARYTRYIYVTEGVYRFTAIADDGMRIFVDDQLIMDQWKIQAERTYVVDRALTTGHHLVRVEYFENNGTARAAVRWERAGGPQPPSPTYRWRGEYFNNRDFAGDPVLVRDDAEVNFVWGTSSPAPGTVTPDNFSVRWTRNLDLPAGNYRFTVSVDDGVRLFVNNAHIINEWREQSVRTFSSDIYLPGGSIPVRMEYFEATQGAEARLWWTRIDGGGGGGGGGDDDDDDIDTDIRWRARYYTNINLSGTPVIDRHESNIDNDWGTGGPSGLGKTDWFSVRWSTRAEFAGGDHRFVVEVDDGARLYIDGDLVLDKWFAQKRTRYSVTVDLDRGEHDIVLEYMERTSVAFIRLSIARPVEHDSNVGNIITCVPPQPNNYAWIKLYRLNGDNKWYSTGRGIGSISATGFLKIDGVPVDVGRFGGNGEPYKVEQWIDGRIRNSTGDFLAGQPEFRVRVDADNYTPWGCSR